MDELLPFPSPSRMRTGRSVAHFATPLVDPSAVPATCVPCPESSCTSPETSAEVPEPSHADGAISTKLAPPPTRPRNSEWLVRAPVSTTNTSTPRPHRHSGAANAPSSRERSGPGTPARRLGPGSTARQSGLLARAPRRRARGRSAAAAAVAGGRGGGRTRRLFGDERVVRGSSRRMVPFASASAFSKILKTPSPASSSTRSISPRASRGSGASRVTPAEHGDRGTPARRREAGGCFVTDIGTPSRGSRSRAQLEEPSVRHVFRGTGRCRRSSEDEDACFEPLVEPHSGSRRTPPPTNPRGAYSRPKSRPPPKYGDCRAGPEGAAVPEVPVPEGAAFASAKPVAVDPGPRPAFSRADGDPSEGGENDDSPWKSSCWGSAMSSFIGAVIEGVPGEDVPASASTPVPAPAPVPRSNPSVWSRAPLETAAETLAAGTSVSAASAVSAGGRDAGTTAGPSPRRRIRRMSDTSDTSDTSVSDEVGVASGRSANGSSGTSPGTSPGTSASEAPFVRRRRDRPRDRRSPEPSLRPSRRQRRLARGNGDVLVLEDVGRASVFSRIADAYRGLRLDAAALRRRSAPAVASAAARSASSSRRPSRRRTSIRGDALIVSAASAEDVEASAEEASQRAAGRAVSRGRRRASSAVAASPGPRARARGARRRSRRRAARSRRRRRRRQSVADEPRGGYRPRNWVRTSPRVSTVSPRRAPARSPREFAPGETTRKLGARGG